jgi:hypothetical protein
MLENDERVNQVKGAFQVRETVGLDQRDIVKVALATVRFASASIVRDEAYPWPASRERTQIR